MRSEAEQWMFILRKLGKCVLCGKPLPHMMLVGTYKRNGTHHCADCREPWRNVVRKLGITKNDYAAWYITNPDQMNRLRVTAFNLCKEQDPIEEALELVHARHRCVICFGKISPYRLKLTTKKLWHCNGCDCLVKQYKAGYKQFYAEDRRAQLDLLAWVEKHA